MSSTKRRKPAAVKQRGRPKRVLDENVIVGLGSIGCTDEEIALIVGCTRKTLEVNYYPALQKSRAQMKMSLRRKQYQQAMEGHGWALIWLGKNLLGQSEKLETINRQGPPKTADPKDLDKMEELGWDMKEAEEKVNGVRSS
jgi:hypothetical protein